MSSSVVDDDYDDDDFYSNKIRRFDRTISDDSHSMSSQSSDENPMAQITTNLKIGQLASFHRFSGPKKSDLILFSNKNPIYIEIPEIYANCTGTISVIRHDNDKRHDNLRLVSLNTYPIYQGNIIFKITPDILKKFILDFFEIHFTDDDKEKEDIEDAYKRNTARLCMNIYNDSGDLIISFISSLIRNINLRDLVSEDISLLQIKPDKTINNLTTYLIRLKNKIPYFPDELEIKIEGSQKKFTPTTKRYFPCNEFIIHVSDKIKCTASNTSIICKTFDKKYSPRQNQKNANIEKRKMANTKPIQNSKSSSDTIQSSPIPESKTRKKEICLVISHTKFDDTNLKSREVGSENDVSEIEKMFSETLNYDVHIFRSLSTQELKDEIKNELDNFELYHDHIVVFVLSHGDNNMFNTRDGSIKYDEFVKLFLPQISDKPKLFFFSCCQGKEVNTLNKKLIPKDILETKSASSENFFKVRDLPKYSDIFMGFSTVPDCYGLRVDHVTPYIHTLLDFIRENPALKVTEIQKKTHRKMKEKWKTYLTIPCVYHCLTRDVYLKQK